MNRRGLRGVSGRLRRFQEIYEGLRGGSGAFQCVSKGFMVPQGLPRVFQVVSGALQGVSEGFQGLRGDLDYLRGVSGALSGFLRDTWRSQGNIRRFSEALQSSLGATP